MTDPHAESADLVRRWQAGDGQAFEAIVTRYLPWIEEQVRARVGPVLRGKAETQDYVQNVLVEILRYGPAAVIESPDHFRNLVVRIVEHHLRDQHDWFTAARRAVGREAPMPSETEFFVADQGPTPSRAAVGSESQRWLRLALHFLDPDDRRAILMREWEGCSFDEIGRRLGTTAEGARKRFHRALPRLLEQLARLKREILEGPSPVSDLRDTSLERLSQALEVAVAWRNAGAREAPGDLLRQHPALRDLLEPMLAAEVDSASDVENESLAGTSLGGFELQGELGRGAMGIVYRARQTSLGRDVAVKVLTAAGRLSPRAQARFLREAELVARLEHPGIVRIHEVGCDRGLHFSAMERVDGLPLDHLLNHARGRPFSAMTGADVLHLLQPDAARSDPPEPFDGGWFTFVARLVRRVALALQHAHESGVVHRDVKPSNILVRRNGQPVLTDFGLARDEATPSLSATGELAGTPYYVAPEQVRGGAVNRRCDVFSLGVTLYELLTHRVPFDGATTHEVLERIVRDDPPDPCRVAPGVPPDLGAIALQAVEKDPGRRYQSALEMGDDLLAWLEHRPVRARRLSLPLRSLRWARREPFRAALLVLLFLGLPLLVGAGGYVLLQQEKHASQRILAAKEESDHRLATAVSAVHELLMGLSASSLRVPGTREIRERFYQQAIGFLERLKDAPQARPLLVRAHSGLADVLRELDRHAGAQEHASAALAVHASLGAAAEEEQRWAAQAHAVLGASLARQGRSAEATRAHGAALEACQQVLKREPGDDEVRAILADVLEDLAARMAETGEVDAGVALLEQAITERRQLAAKGGDDAVGQLANSLLRLGWQSRTRSIAAAKRYLEEAITTGERLPASRSGTRAHLVGTAHQRLGLLLQDQGDSQAAERHHREAVRHAEAYLREHPDLPEARSHLAAKLNDLGITLRRLSRLDEAIACAERAIELQKDAIAAAPDVPSFRTSLDHHFATKAEAHFQSRQPTELAATAEELGQTTMQPRFCIHAALALLQAVRLGRLAAAMDEEREQAWTRRAVTFLLDAEQRGGRYDPRLDHEAFELLRRDSEGSAVLERLRALR